MTYRFCAVIVCGTLLIGAGSSTGAGSSIRLLCDYREDPMAVETPAPDLRWVFPDNSVVRQSAYRVCVASRESLLHENSPDLWDSGWVKSAAQRATYAGKPLSSGDHACWTLDVRDSEGNVTTSGVAWWTVGLLDPQDWEAEWIAAEEASPPFGNARWIWSNDTQTGDPESAATPGVRFFRRHFALPPEMEVKETFLEITADNAFLAYINGHEAGRGDRWEQAYRFDVRAAIETGDNVLAVRAANGGQAPNPAGLLARLLVTFADGTQIEIATDAAWKCAPDGESGWNTVAFGDRDWAPACDIGPYGAAPWGTTAKDATPLPMPIFRKVFAIDGTPLRRAEVFICGLGHFELTLNGAKVGDHFIDPGWTDYADSCLYVPFDVTSTLKPGMNAIGVMLGNGMYNVVGGRYAKFTGSFGPPKLILQMRIEYEDGTVQHVVSDDTWKTDDGPIVFSCVYGGEDYDARREQPGWDTASFDDREWKAVRIVEGPGGALRAQSAPPIKVIQRLRPASIVCLEPGRYEVDLGENLSSRPFITVEGAAGSQVTVETAERKGQPWPGHSYTYTLKGEGGEVFYPRFTYFGFQFLYVSGVDWGEDANTGSGRPRLIEARADFVSSSAAPVGRFVCSNPLLNDIDAMIDRSVRSNLQHVLTDCPHREKLGWLEVAHLMGPSILYHYDAYGLYRKICRDTAESQLENGLVPDIAPEYVRFNEGFLESAEWGSACVQLPWLLYRWYGDVDALRTQYPVMARYTEYLASTRNPQGLAKGGLGDWYDWTPERGHAGYSQLTPLELTATCMLYDNARILEKTAALIGDSDSERRWHGLASEVHQAFLVAYYDAEEKNVSTGSQASLAAALHFGLVPEADREAVQERLVHTIEEEEYRPSTGEVCFRYLVLTLAEAGRSDIVYRIVNRTDAPGYGCMLRQHGLRTLSECWDKPGSSLNHCMFGHIQEWFQGYVLGIRQTPGSIGFEGLLIAPATAGDLTHAEGSFDSPRGPISVDWTRTEGRFDLSLSVPGNTEADVVLPDGNAAWSQTPEGPRIPLLKAFPKDAVRSENGQTHVRVGAGPHTFVVESL